MISMDTTSPVESIDILTDDKLKDVTFVQFIHCHVSQRWPRLLNSLVKGHAVRVRKRHTLSKLIVLPLLSHGCLLPAARSSLEYSVETATVVRDTGRSRDTCTSKGHHAVGLSDHLSKLSNLYFELFRRVKEFFLLLLVLNA